jgi:hypothetical protein
MPDLQSAKWKVTVLLVNSLFWSQVNHINMYLVAILNQELVKWWANT